MEEKLFPVGAAKAERNSLCKYIAKYFIWHQSHYNNSARTYKDVVLANKILKIKKSREFDKVFNSGKKFYIDKIAAVYFLIAQKPDIYLGIVTSKKIGKAVLRNKAKRTIQEIIRKEKNRLTPGLNLVIVPRRQILDFKFNQRVDLFLNCFKEQGIYLND